MASLALAATAFGADADVKELVEQNRLLAEQVRAQQKQIDELRSRLDRMDEPASPVKLPSGESDRSIRLSGEVSIGYFDGQKNSWAPTSEFRVDDARIFVEASVWKNVFLYGALEITTREANDEYFHVGELYVDVEDLWRGGRNHSLSLRAGRMNLPFGEEYLVRNAIDNPLISHSLADIWAHSPAFNAFSYDQASDTLYPLPDNQRTAGLPNGGVPGVTSPAQLEPRCPGAASQPPADGSAPYRDRSGNLDCDPKIVPPGP